MCSCFAIAILRRSAYHNRHIVALCIQPVQQIGSQVPTTQKAHAGFPVLISGKLQRALERSSQSNRQGMHMSDETAEIMPENPAKTDQALFDYLDALGIAHSTKNHPAVFTVSESQSLRDEIPGSHTKNLFLKDKKDNFFLVTVEEDAQVDLKFIHTIIGARGRVSFGKPDRLMAYLGVVPGSVTAFGVINDSEGRVKVVLDAALLEHDIINAHPLRNDATTSIQRDDLLRFLESTGHEPLIAAVSTKELKLRPTAPIFR